MEGTEVVDERTGESSGADAEIGGSPGQRPRRGPSRPQGRRRNPGRVVATAVFWAATLYMVVVGFVSITSQVFWPETGAAATEACGPALVELKAELMAEASARAARGGIVDDHDALRRRLATWDARYNALRTTCTRDLPGAYADLGRLRYGVENSLRHMDRTLGPLSEKVDRELERSGASP